MDTKVVVIGGGAAGMLAAGTAASFGAQVVLLEKNRDLGKKLLITGKGRCNITNAGTLEEIMKNIPRNSQFLYSSLYGFTNQDLLDMLQALGLDTKVERGNRVFPVSDKAQDVVNSLLDYCRQYGVDIKCNREVQEILVENGQVRGVVTTQGEKILATRVIVATGGLSAPGTGSTGDGYNWAQLVGHQIVDTQPSLVPLETKETWVKEAQGLALKNVQVGIMVAGKLVAQEFGEMLFAHFGVTGPVILTLSDVAVDALGRKQGPVELTINLKPALTVEQLDKRLQRDFADKSRKQFKNAFEELLPKSLIPILISLSGIDPEKPIHQVSKLERQKLIQLMTDLRLTVAKPRSIKEAVITAGGVHIKEINPKTLESKLVQGLYFAGEVLDVHAYTGGFNLQIAFSTGYAAGSHAAQSLF